MTTYEIGDSVTARLPLRKGQELVSAGDSGNVTGIGLDGTLEINFSGTQVWVRPWMVQPVCRVCGAELVAPGSACADCVAWAGQGVENV